MTKKEEPTVDKAPGKDTTGLTFVAYDHVSGKPFLVDKVRGVVTEVPLGLPDGKEALKNAVGHYRTEVRNECKRLYIAGINLNEISRRTGVPIIALENWAYSKHRASEYDSKSWAAERKRMWAEIKQRNEEVYSMVERKALKKVEQYLASDASDITSPEQFSIFAGGLAKLTKAVNGDPAQKTNQKSQATQVNVTVNPLTPEESRQLIENDPIRKIAEASSRVQVNQALEDAEITESPAK